MRFRTPRLLPLLLLVALAGCREAAQSNLPTVQMPLGGRDFTLEIADDNATRETGLMYRDTMPEDHGMLFVFPDEQPRSFYMKNTHIDLDIVFADSVGKVVSVGHMRAYDLHDTPSEGPARYAIELNAGTAAKVGVKAGDKLAIPPNVPPGKG